MYFSTIFAQDSANKRNERLLSNGLWVRLMPLIIIVRKMNVSDLYNIYLRHPQVTTDSRSLPATAPTDGSDCGIFVALKGASFDGNKFAAMALEHGCSHAVIDEKEYLVEGDDRYILVDNALTTFKELAREHRRHFHIPVVGITGTNGKTTTKELVSVVLAKHYRVMHTEGNFNNDVGVPKTLLRLSAHDEIAVVEMGASHPGDIRKLVEYVEPTQGLITNVGRAHLQGFGSFEGVMQTKGELYDWLKAHQAEVYANLSNPHLSEMLADRHIDTVVSYGQSDALSRYQVTGRVVACNPYVKLQWEYTPEDGDNAGSRQQFDVQTQLVGTYNADNLLAAVAVGLHNGVTPQQVNEALADYRPTNDRSELERTASNLLIVDAYNANPSSMAAALDNFARITVKEPKMAILGDMRELGATSVEEHQRVVDTLETLGLTDVWLVGSEFAKTHTRFRRFGNVEEVKAAIATCKPQGKCILVKGSNGTKLFELPKLL